MSDPRERPRLTNHEPSRQSQPQPRHRRTDRERRLEQRMGELASRLGSGLRESRLMIGRGQAEAAARAGLSQPRYSELERGEGAGATIGTWMRAADGVGQRFTAFLERVPTSDLPRDYQHLRRQQLVIRVASPGGWIGLAEESVDLRSVRSRSIDVFLRRPPRREAAVIEIWDWFDDFGASIRASEAKAFAIGETLNSGLSLNAEPWRASILWVVRSTLRNRRLIGEFATLLDARFPAPSAEWLRALTGPDSAMPAQAGLVWSDVRGERLFARRGRGT